MPEEKSFDKYLERRAEQLGLPTDPEAYQDGGLAVAATARNLAEAEAVAMYLKSCDVPAWVDSPLSALYSEGYIRPSIAVRVPLGRLADAQKFLAQHEGNATAPEGVEEPPDQGDSETEEPPEVAPETEWPPRRPLTRTLLGLFFLTLGFGYLAGFAAWMVFQHTNASAAGHVFEFLIMVLVAASCCVIGIIALRRPREGT